MSVNLKSKSARDALKPRREPYWHRVAKGLYVGYRRPETGAGTWIARRRSEEGTQQYKALGTLDTLDEAVKLATAWGADVDQGVSHTSTTVKTACENYVANLKTEKKSEASATDAEGRFRRLVYDRPIGRIALDKLRPAIVRKWRNDQRDVDGDEDDLRRSKDSANRNLNALKAALNFARMDGLVATDAGWKIAKPFADAGKRRTGDLNAAGRAELLKQCPPHLHDLVKALLLTAVRPGEIAAANVGDFNKDQGSMVLTGKTGTRTVTLSTAAVAFFKTCAKDKLPSAPLLADEYGKRWNKDSWKTPFREACKAAKLPADTVMYTLRHVAISDMIAGGVDSFVVARLAGTSTGMIDKHYGHLRHDITRAKLDQAHAANG